MRTYFLAFFASIAWVLLWLHSEETECSFSLKDEQVQLRHIEGKGIGYNQGYTTIQAFFTPHFEGIIPLFDFRAAVFDDGKFAANAGSGFRILSTQVYGVNAFYDYRQTHHFHYNQIGLGFEVLGKRYDFRANGYLPIGKKQSALSEHDHHKEHVFKGGNAEFGVHLYHTDLMELYGAIGPYFFVGKGRAFGGKMRFSATFLKHVRFEVDGSYDPVFKGIGQGQISLMYFFGPKGLSSCSQGARWASSDRASQWIERQEIIVVN